MEPRSRLPRLVERLAILVFVVLSAPLIAGLMTTVIAAIYFMVFSDAPLAEGDGSGPYLLAIGAAIYGTLCWLVLKDN